MYTENPLVDTIFHILRLAVFIPAVLLAAHFVVKISRHPSTSSSKYRQNYPLSLILWGILAAAFYLPLLNLLSFFQEVGFRLFSTGREPINVLMPTFWGEGTWSLYLTLSFSTMALGYLLVLWVGWRAIHQMGEIPFGLSKTEVNLLLLGIGSIVLVGFQAFIHSFGWVGLPVFDRPLTTHTGGVIAGWGFSLLLLVVLGFLFFYYLNNKNEELEEENS
jgi:hypothetical protein